MNETIGVVNKLMEELSRLPGIGRKTAERLTFHLLNVDIQEAHALADAIVELRQKVRPCSVCYNLTESDPCSICSDPRRDQSILCVVEGPGDVAAIEKAGGYRGLYHILGGALSPLDGVRAEDLTIDDLEERIQQGDFKEIIIATNPNTEGETTAHYLTEKLLSGEMVISRIALGLPMGSDLELADKVTLGRALAGRQVLSDTEKKE